jgi:hypothetical protein
MATLRKHRNKWQSIVRVQGHPTLCKSFVSRTDAKRWATEAEIKIRREDAGVAKMHFPKFEDVARKYYALPVSCSFGYLFIKSINAISPLAKSFFTKSVALR